MAGAHALPLILARLDSIFLDLTVYHIFALFGVAVLIGMSKTGVHGAGMMAVPILASAYGGQASTGLLLPILCMADILGVWYYHRHASWDHLKKLFPWAAIGTVLGVVAGRYMDDHMFKAVMASAIVAIVAAMIWVEKRGTGQIPQNRYLAATIGITGGFTSMVGNLAGSVMAIYFISMKLPKNVFIGTTAWFFLVMNFFKVPFHIFAWKTITAKTFLLNLSSIPFILLGGLIGIAIVKRISEQLFRWFIIAMTLLAGLIMLI
jgi:uncharacterized protein